MGGKLQATQSVFADTKAPNSAWIWPGYRWSLCAHRWDRAFLLLLVICFLILTLYEIRTLTLFAWRAAQSGAVADLGLSFLALAGLFGFASGNSVWLLYRWGSLRLFERELRMPPGGLMHCSSEDRVVLLIPSYREAPGDVRLSMLSAALQSYPNLEIVLLVDDPDAEALRCFEQVAAELREFRQGLCPDPDAVQLEMAVARVTAERNRLWNSGVTAQKDFVQTTLDPWIAHWQSASPGDPEMRRRLQAISRRSLRVFSRKRYANLTQRPTKAVNLNMETHFTIQRRLYDYQFSLARPPAELEQCHQAFMRTYNTTAHQGLQRDRRLPPIPVEVLGAVKGRQYTPQELARAFSQAVFPRTTNRFGCVTLHSYHFYVEAGLPQTQVLLWVAGTQLRAAFDDVILAEYHCRYDWRDRRVKDVRPGVFHPTRFASPQGALLPLAPHDSTVVYRTRARR
jgi:hypothetical protein